MRVTLIVGGISLILLAAGSTVVAWLCVALVQYDFEETCHMLLDRQMLDVDATNAYLREQGSTLRLTGERDSLGHTQDDYVRLQRDVLEISRLDWLLLTNLITNVVVITIGAGLLACGAIPWKRVIARA